ncbi:hypothetical protein X768_10700 [Mesorhizobium sp. LSJC265A00]|nr:hypothetical protein X768_10700 [Mesorhizobium sp. LSJC265A00]
MTMLVLVGPKVFDQLVEVGGIVGMQPHAAMRRRPSQPLDGVGRMHGVAAAEEDRMRHRRVVVFLRMPHLVHAGRLERAGRRDMRTVAGRDLPGESRPAIDQHFHGLLRQRNTRHDLVCRGMGGAVGGAKQKRGAAGCGGDVDEFGGNGFVHDGSSLPVLPASIRWPPYPRAMFQTDFAEARLCFESVSSG